MIIDGSTYAFNGVNIARNYGASRRWEKGGGGRGWGNSHIKMTEVLVGNFGTISFSGCFSRRVSLSSEGRPFSELLPRKFQRSLNQVCAPVLLYMCLL